jgi:hypothetical protein
MTRVLHCTSVGDTWQIMHCHERHFETVGSLQGSPWGDGVLPKAVYRGVVGKSWQNLCCQKAQWSTTGRMYTRWMWTSRQRLLGGMRPDLARTSPSQSCLHTWLPWVRSYEELPTFLLPTFLLSTFLPVFLTSAKLCLERSGSARQYFRNSPDWCGVVSGKDL